MNFSHPLARTARLLHADSIENGQHDVFVVVTTLELDPKHKKFKPAKVQKLREACRDHLRQNLPAVREILLTNPLKA